jgi:hypothetical protein
MTEADDYYMRQYTSSPVGLQRKCACGGLCPECRKKAQTLQRKAQTRGQPLEAATRAFIEPRFGHDFSQVRVHADAEAADSAQMVSALAFTIGQNIYFGADKYQPGSKEGRRLLAHELAHTIQQRGGEHPSTPVPPSEDSRLEAEAEHAAGETLAGRATPITAGVSTPTLQRQDKDKKSQVQAPKIVPPVEPSAGQKKMIDAARRAAAIRTQTAMFKASGVQGAGDFSEARGLAQLKFDWANPNMDQISEVLSGMGGGLVSVDVKVAGPGDPECGSRSGYVRGHQPPIVLCPGFFRDPANNEGRIRTMVHEMAHVKGIGKADAGEEYFPIFDCTSKGAFESADAWANYVNCLSGQRPDKAIEIVVPRPGNKAGTSTPKKSGGNK